MTVEMEMQGESTEPLTFVTRSVSWSSLSSCVLHPDDGDCQNNISTWYG